MKRSIWIWAFSFWACCSWAQTNTVIRLAIVAETPEVGSVADLITAEFSKNPRLQLLERNEIDKVIREQGLSAGNGDYLKLGQLLGADGLLLLGLRQIEMTNSLSVQLIAVDPGVLLLSEHFGWSEGKPVRYVAPVAKLIGPFIPKLGIVAKAAIPVSVINLRSAMESAQSRDLEQQLTFLAIERLSQERHLFVLERRQMQLLSQEKEWVGTNNAAFWNGSYLLDGTVSDGGYPEYFITINARLVPPQGGQSVSVVASGSGTNLAAIINELGGKVMASLQVTGETPAWNAADEAARFYDEAQWAMKWRLYPQALAASESAWALGRQDAETAALRVRAYSENVPLGNGFNYFARSTEAWECLHVVAFPDVAVLNPLTRALEIFHQNATLLLQNTNSGFSDAEMGVELLGRAASVLESYYYAAEARVGNEAALVDLRAAMWLVFSDLAARPASTSRKRSDRGTPQRALSWLKWEEGGLCFEQPEQALPMFRQQLEAGYHPGHLPRLVGWSWEDRKRVPGLLRRFVTDACASTNAGVRLEGLFLQLLGTPNDGTGSLQQSEQALTAAMWENHDLLLTNADFATLIVATRNALRAKEGDRYPVGPFAHEAFTSVVQRLRMEFLAQTTDANWELISAWFVTPGNEPIETPEQARELLALATNCQQRLKSPKLLEGVIGSLRREAGVAPAPPTEVAPAEPAAEVLDVKFIPWNVSGMASSAEQKPRIEKVILRNGLLWSYVRLVTQNTFVFDTANLPHVYLAVSPAGGIKMEIPCPASLGLPSDLFEVSSNALFVVADGHLYRRLFERNDWEEIPASLDGVRQMVWAGNRLFIGRNDGLIEVDPATKMERLLASSRRQPPVNEIDSLWTPGATMRRWSDGRLGVVTGNRCLSLDVASGQWLIRGATNLLGASTRVSLFAGRQFTSDGGVQGYLPFAPLHRYLAGFWNGNNSAELLLVGPSPYTNKVPNRLPSPRWDWPQTYSLEDASIASGEERLWVLSPRKVFRPIPKEPVKFSDSREATLSCFESGFRQPLVAAVSFEEDPALVVQAIDGHPTGPRNPLSFDLASNMKALSDDGNGGRCWLASPAGLVLAAPAYCGHWLVPNEALESRFSSQRQTLSRQPGRDDVPLPATSRP